VRLFARRRSLASLAASLVIAVLLGLGIPPVRGAAPPVHGQGSDRASVLLRLWNAEDTGDVDGAIAQFAGDAVYIGTMPKGNCSVQTPCTDLPGIRQQIQRNMGIHFCTTIHWLQVSGAVLTGEREIQSDYDFSIGVDHIVQNFIAVVTQDKITFIAGVLNLGDAETAVAHAIDEGTQASRAPIISARPPCAQLL